MFLRLGATSFGGPAAHIALMEHEVVGRRRWITRDAFMDVVGSVNLIPGPNSTEVAIHVGYARAGWQGLIVAGTCFILPAALLVTAVAWSYVRFGTVPALVAVLYGIKPVVLAIIVQAIWRLGRTALTTPRTIAIAVLSVIASTLGVHELIILAGAALSGLATTWRRQTGLPILLPWDWSSAWRSSHWPLAIAATGVAGSVGLWPLFGVFLKIGSVLFGSGYVLLAFLRADLVERYHWITERQLLDAIAVGQVTPGSALHERDVHRLRHWRSSWRRGRDDWDFSAGVHLRGAERAISAETPSESRGRRIPRRTERRVARADGRGHRLSGPDGDCRSADTVVGDRCRLRPAFQLAECDMAHSRRSVDGLARS